MNGERGRGEYLKVYDHHGSFIVLSPEDEPRVDAAVSSYVDSGGTRDRIIETTLLEGGSYKMLASTVASWFVTTAEARRERAAIDAENQREQDDFKQELGIWDDVV